MFDSHSAFYYGIIFTFIIKKNYTKPKIYDIIQKHYDMINFTYRKKKGWKL